MDTRKLSANALRSSLVATVLEWEHRYGVAPAITSALSEFDAAQLVGHTPKSFSLECAGKTAVTRGVDFCHKGLRYQVKGNRPSGKRGSFVTLVPKAKNYEWDRLIWILYDREFRVVEAWKWTVNAYRREFHSVDRISPMLMRKGRQIHGV